MFSQDTKAGKGDRGRRGEKEATELAASLKTEKRCHTDTETQRARERQPILDDLVYSRDLASSQQTDRERETQRNRKRERNNVLSHLITLYGPVVGI